MDKLQKQKQNQRLLAAFRFWRVAAFVTMGASLACIGAASACVGRLTAEIEEGKRLYEEHLKLDRLKEQKADQERIAPLVAVMDEPEDTIEIPAGGQTEPEYEYLGEFTITAYCPCEKCCGPWTDGITAMGTTAEPGVIAVDKSIIPLGSTVLIDGQEYRAEDTGGAIRGNRIDVYCESHNAALEYGVQHHEVLVAVE